MERRELIEWILIIAIIVAWWPWIFLGYSDAWYRVLIFYVSPLALIFILVVRVRRVQRGLDYSQKVMDERHKASGANVLGYPPVPSGAPEPRSEDAPGDNGDEA
jgi:hypothetical protein